jgi:hypothetical protein
MKTIKHSLHFETVLDENEPTVQKLLELPENEQVELLEAMLLDLIAPELEPILKKLNENNSYATLKVVA